MAPTLLPKPALFLAAVLASLAFALAVPHRLAPRSFAVPVSGRGLRAPRQEVLRTYQKFGWNTSTVAGDIAHDIAFQLNNIIASASSASVRPSRRTADGEVAATPEDNGSEYIAPVSIGGQSLNLDFDTGSSDLWVFSTELNPQNIGQHTAFDANKSSTWQDLPGASWHITYGDGSFAQGVVGYDVVNVGGSTANQQCVELATNMAGSFETDVSSNGLLGLAFGSLNTVRPQQQKTFFENVMPGLSQPLFTVDLTDSAGSGTYEFGTIDQSKFTGDIHYAPVNSSQGFWQFTSPSYSINGKQTSCTTCHPVIADTGTSLVYLDPETVMAFYAGVDGARSDPSQGGWIYNCDAKLPDLGIAIGPNYFAVLNGAETTYATLGPQSPNMCFGGIQESAQNFQILGDVFLRQFFAVFDGGNMQFGIAQQ